MKMNRGHFPVSRWHRPVFFAVWAINIPFLFKAGAPWWALLLWAAVYPGTWIFHFVMRRRWADAAWAVAAETENPVEFMVIAEVMTEMTLTEMLQLNRFLGENRATLDPALLTDAPPAVVRFAAEVRSRLENPPQGQEDGR